MPKTFFFSLFFIIASSYAASASDIQENLDLMRHKNQVSSYMFLDDHVDGDFRFAAESVDKPGEIKIWERRSGIVRFVTTLRGHDYKIRQISLISKPDAKALFSSCNDGQGKIWILKENQWNLALTILWPITSDNMYCDGFFDSFQELFEDLSSLPHR